MDRITLLPEATQKQIRSSISILTLTDVVLELIKNAFDAQAVTIKIELDYSKGYCGIIDNGCGIPAHEFQQKHIARMHYTSKSDEPGRYYGRYGRFLSHLSSISLLSITSRHKQELSESSIIYNGGKLAASSIEDRKDFDHNGIAGTTVTIRNLFANLPVRYRHFATKFLSLHEIEREFRRLKMRLVALQLAASALSRFTIIEKPSQQKYVSRPSQAHTGTFDLKSILCILSQAGLVGAEDHERWHTASARTTSLCVRAAISTTPVATREVQFISVGCHPLGTASGGAFFDEVNHIFERLGFGRDVADAAAQKSGSRQQSKDTVLERDGRPQTSARPLDCWPMFYIRVDLLERQAVEGYFLENGPSNRQAQEMLDVLRPLVSQFLATHHLCPSSSLPLRFGVHKSASREADRLEKTLCLRTSPSLHDKKHRHRPFGGWKRAKQGRPVSSGQCCPKPEAGSDQIVVDGGRASPMGISQSPKMLYQSMVDDDKDAPPCNEFCNSSPYFGLAAQAISTDESLKWVDPRTGAVVSLDARTGLVTPSGQTSKHFTSGQLFPQPASIRQAGLNEQPISNPPPKTLSSTNHTADLGNLLSAGNRFSYRPEEAPLNSVALEGFGVEHSKSSYDRERLGTAFTKFVADRRLSKHAFTSAQALGQVDRKFILVRTTAGHSSRPNPPNGHDYGDGSLLVLIDQHAADERVRVESLFEELCGAQAIVLHQPMMFEVCDSETERFEHARQYFKSWSIVYWVRQREKLENPRATKSGVRAQAQFKRRPVLSVTALPPLIVERCREDPQCLIDLLRSVIWSTEGIGKNLSTSDDADWLLQMSTCPRKLVEMVNSRACRSAIMFNDHLSLDQCHTLVKRLANCRLPFRCAHGRPSMAVLTSVDSLDIPRNCEQSFGAAWKVWQGMV